MMSGLELREWAEKLQAGDQTFVVLLLTAFGRQCEKHLMEKFQCREEEAADVLMDVVADLLDRMVKGNIPAIDNPGGYLMKACEYRYLLLAKRSRQEREKSRDVLYFFYDELYEEDQLQRLLDSELREVVEAEKQKKLHLILEALQVLKEKCRRILELFYVEGRSMSEIAAIMSFAGSDVAKTTKNRCYKKWKGEIDKLLLVKQ